ncbi:hypothetical protein KM472_gp095 [Cynomolgus macaque cytomegalovirus strain Ottawa]|uniref:Uncharacterized protein n=1 Tax=macacine betaherpesvirus 8 TaxID=2560567 RepID=G8H198_9BETA|nr:hypothetical protein KM472_gp095 [Cynomolgus macaque cytomegalovirus strain Ottawa]AEQ32172.1 hypothetical protein cy92 [Cynomolgus macaque cytomegalovirus strain Ottawa]
MTQAVGGGALPQHSMRGGGWACRSLPELSQGSSTWGDGKTDPRPTKTQKVGAGHRKHRPIQLH